MKLCTLNSWLLSVCFLLGTTEFSCSYLSAGFVSTIVLKDVFWFTALGFLPGGFFICYFVFKLRKFITSSHTCELTFIFT